MGSGPSYFSRPDFSNQCQDRFKWNNPIWPTRGTWGESDLTATTDSARLYLVNYLILSCENHDHLASGAMGPLRQA